MLLRKWELCIYPSGQLSSFPAELLRIINLQAFKQDPGRLHIFMFIKPFCQKKGRSLAFAWPCHQPTPIRPPTILLKQGIKPLRKFNMRLRDPHATPPHALASSRDVDRSSQRKGGMNLHNWRVSIAHNDQEAHHCHCLLGLLCR